MNKWEKLDKDYIWHPFTQMKGWNENEQLVIERGEGVKLYDTEGRSYYDGISSLWVNIHGHHRSEIDRSPGINYPVSTCRASVLNYLTHFSCA